MFSARCEGETGMSFANQGRRLANATTLLTLLAQPLLADAREPGTEQEAHPAEGAPPETAALASHDATSLPVDPLFADQDLLELRIEGPIRAVVRDRDPEPEDRPATMAWTPEEGEGGTLAIEIRARGKSRRLKEKCDFPPIRLDIPRKAADGTLFENQDKLKLVTHCTRLGSSTRTQFEWLWLEYYAYRVLNVLTEYSFRVRPLEVTYVPERGKEATHPAFLIESEERLARRLGLERNERPRIERNELVELTNLMEVFNFFLGNTDFSFLVGTAGAVCCHNAKQLTDGDGHYLPIPYDFDQTGLLDKPDAIPAANVGIRDVTDRRYRGLCREPRILEETLARFRDKRSEIDGLLAQETFTLPDRRRRKAAKFIEEFWEILDDPRKIEREFVDRCR